MKTLIVGRSRWVGPGATRLVVLASAWIVVALTTLWTFTWARRSAPQGQVLAEAARAVEGPIPLPTPLDVAWTFAVENGEIGLGAPIPELDHPLPPPLCAPGDETGLNVAIRELERSIDATNRGTLERRLEALARLDLAGPDARSLIRSFALARGYLSAGDAVAAAQFLDTGAPAAVGAPSVPIVTAQQARRLVDEGTVDPNWAAAVVQVRYLAGLAALHRGRPADAIPQLRFAVNALAFLVPSGEEAVTRTPRARRLAVDPGRYGCSDEAGARSLDSMDLYAALVAAYLGAEGFDDRSRLEAELRRGDLDVDPGDPLAPVLEGARDGTLEVASHLLWAASNLQRVEHNNRIRSDSRVSLTRGMLVLQLTEVDAAVGRDPVLACRVLQDMGGVRELGRPAVARTPTDSLLAGVTLTILARRANRCPGAATPDPDVRSRLLQIGGHRVAGGLPGRLEDARVEVEKSLAAGAGAGEFNHVLAGLSADQDRLRGGRIPADLLRGLEAQDAAAVMATWRQGLFADVADALLPLLSGPDAERQAAGSSGRILVALSGAERHARLSPRDRYGAREVVWAARSGGAELIVPNLARYGARAYPVATGFLFLAFFGLAALAVLLVHVSWWRYELTVSRRFYVTETLDRWRREMGGADPSGQGGVR